MEEEEGEDDEERCISQFIALTVSAKVQNESGETQKEKWIIVKHDSNKYTVA
jgi:hypothetical protein